MRAAGVLGVAHLTGCGPRVPLRPGLGTGVIAYMRSARGLKGISKAAKKHNHNRVYATVQAALNDPAHPGDRSRVVRIVMNEQMHAQLFAAGNDTADLRLFYNQT